VRGDRLLLAVLLFDTVLLAAIELLFLPLRVGDLGLPDGWLPEGAAIWPLPVSAVLAAVTMPLLVRAAGRFSGRVGVAALPLLLWLVALVVIGLAGPGGDIVLIPDWRLLLLLGAGAFPAAVALGALMGRPPEAGERDREDAAP